MLQARRMNRIVLTLALLTCGFLLTAGTGCDENVTDQITAVEKAQAMDGPGGPTFAWPLPSSVAASAQAEAKYIFDT